MKKLRFIPIMLLLVGVMAFSCFAVGCGDEKIVSDGHTHTFAAEWTTDADAHYHAATCEHTDLVKDKAYHNLKLVSRPATETTCAFTGYVCGCGYGRLADGTPAPVHDFIEHEAQGDGCIRPLVSAYKTCKLCGYSSSRTVTPAKGEHTFDTATWSADDSYHYHASVCGHAEENADRAPHDYIDGSCAVCGHTEPTVFLEFAFTDDNTAYEVVGIGDVTGTEITVPSRYQGKPVVGIANGAFKGNTSITKVTLSQDVQKIGREAFYGCTSLTSLEVRKGCTEIGFAAFAGCTALSQISLPSTLSALPAYVFEGCTALTEIALPDTISSIGEQAFASCVNLATVHLPDSLTLISTNMFFGCTALASLEIPATVTEIRLQAFYGCTALTSIEFPKMLTYIGQSAFEKSGLTAVTVPDGVKEIASYAFRGCAALKTAVISKKVTVAIDNWFSGCGALQSLSMPFAGAHADVQMVGNEVAFGYIFGTQNFEGAVAVKYKEGQTGETTYYVPQSLTSVTIYGATADHWENDVKTTVQYRIKASTFENCTMIKTIRFGELIEYIGKDAFKNCTLTSVIFDEPTGWKQGSHSVTLGDDYAQNAAALLTGEYSGKTWRRS